MVQFPGVRRPLGRIMEMEPAQSAPPTPALVARPPQPAGHPEDPKNAGVIFGPVMTHFAGHRERSSGWSGGCRNAVEPSPWNCQRRIPYSRKRHWQRSSGWSGKCRNADEGPRRRGGIVAVGNGRAPRRNTRDACPLPGKSLGAKVRWIGGLGTQSEEPAEFPVNARAPSAPLHSVQDDRVLDAHSSVTVMCGSARLSSVLLLP